MRNILIALATLTASFAATGGEWTGEFTGEIVGIGVCRDSASMGYQIVKIRDSNGAEIKGYALISDNATRYLENEYGSRYATLLTAYQSASIVTVMVQPVTNNVCGIAVDHVYYGVRVGSF